MTAEERVLAEAVRHDASRPHRPRTKEQQGAFDRAVEAFRRGGVLAAEKEAASQETK